jgi:hypothetical protein
MWENAIVTVLTTTVPAAIGEAASVYAAALRRECPGMRIWVRKGSCDPSLVEMAVLAPEWDADLLERTQELVFCDDVRKDGVLLHVSVYFSDIFTPDFGEYSEVA